MRIKYKVWCLAAAIISIIVCADIYFGYREIESSIRTELLRDAEDFRAIIMSTRRVYQKQFIESGLPVTDATIGFLPAHALSRISAEFHNWSTSGLRFSNVSERPRNPANMANAFELEALAWFKANPAAKSRMVEVTENGLAHYHYTSPIWVEEYCLRCHGKREDAPHSIAAAYADSYDYNIGDLRGVLSIFMPSEELRHQYYSEWIFQIVMHILGYLVLLLALGCLLNKYVVARLARLEESTKKLAAGDYTVRVHR
uniref:Tll0287-like domain-containing protein n=1 Tax=Desulfovibrio sp. TaxID=885 RepID=UPI0026284D61